MLNKELQFSFIIPVHNGEKTIGEAIKSILDDGKSVQAGFEILVVENGSTDHTKAEVEKLGAVHPEVRLLSSETGVSKARNKGIEEARGERILFLDADDLWLPGSMKEILAFNNLPDLSVYSYRKANGIVIHSKEINTGAIDDFRFFLISRPTRRMGVWAKVYKTEFLKNSKIRFDESMKFSEDSDFLLRLSKEAESFYVSDVPIYHYRTDAPSVTRTADPEKINLYEESLKKTYEFVKENENEKIQTAFASYVLINFNVLSVHHVFSTDKPYKIQCREVKEILKRTPFKEAMEKIRISECMSKDLIPQFFRKLHLPFIGNLAYKWKAR